MLDCSTSAQAATLAAMSTVVLQLPELLEVSSGGSAPKAPARSRQQKPANAEVVDPVLALDEFVDAVLSRTPAGTRVEVLRVHAVPDAQACQVSMA